MPLQPKKHYKNIVFLSDFQPDHGGGLLVALKTARTPSAKLFGEKRTTGDNLRNRGEKGDNAAPPVLSGNPTCIVGFSAIGGILGFAYHKVALPNKDDYKNVNLANLLNCPEI